MSSGGLDFPALSSAPSPSRKEQQQRKAAAAAALPDVVPASAAASTSQSPKTPTKRQQQQQQQQQQHHQAAHPHSPQRHAPAAGGSPRTPDRRALSHSNSSSNSHGSSSAAKARPAASPHKTSGGALLDDFDQFFVGTASLIHDIDSATTSDAPRECQPAPDLSRPPCVQSACWLCCANRACRLAPSTLVCCDRLISFVSGRPSKLGVNRRR
jgi:hypothetical protein